MPFSLIIVIEGHSAKSSNPRSGRQPRKKKKFFNLIYLDVEMLVSKERRSERNYVGREIFSFSSRTRQTELHTVLFISSSLPSDPKECASGGIVYKRKLAFLSLQS